MNKIIINPHHCSKEEYQELKDYLTNKCWDWQEISKGCECVDDIDTICFYDLKLYLNKETDKYYFIRLIDYKNSQTFLTRKEAIKAAHNKGLKFD